MAFHALQIVAIQEWNSEFTDYYENSYSPVIQRDRNFSSFVS